MKRISVISWPWRGMNCFSEKPLERRKMAKFVFQSNPIPAGISAEEWNDWTWQLRRGLKSKEDIAAKFTLSSDEELAFDQGQGLFQIRATPYAASLAGNFPEDPLRKIMMPHARELGEASQQMLD